MDIDIYTNKHLLVKDTISIVIQKQSLWINNENGLNHTLQRQYKDMVRLYKMAQDEDLMYSITIIANKLHDFSEHSKDYKNLKNILPEFERLSLDVRNSIINQVNVAKPHFNQKELDKLYKLSQSRKDTVGRYIKQTIKVCDHTKNPFLFHYLKKILEH